MGNGLGSGGVSICEDKSRSLNDDAIIIALTFLITRTTELDIDPFARPETRLITRRGEVRRRVANQVCECRDTGVGFNRVRSIERVCFIFFFFFRFTLEIIRNLPSYFSPSCWNNEIIENLGNDLKFAPFS